jgi:endonuclease VIII
MAEGDTILRAARRIEAALGGQVLSVTSGNDRGRAAGVERLDGRRLDSVDTHGKHLLLRFDDRVLHSHLGMSGSWHLYRRGEPWRKPRSAAWVALAGEDAEAAQLGGPTLRLLWAGQLRRDRVLARLGPDVLASGFDLEGAVRAFRASSERELGDALLDQRLVAGIGNIFKSEACHAAEVNPWRRIGDLADTDLRRTLEAARNLMQESIANGRPSPNVYQRAGAPCPVCGSRVEARGQGDANRRTWWCPCCQGPGKPLRRAS